MFKFFEGGREVAIIAVMVNAIYDGYDFSLAICFYRDLFGACDIWYCYGVVGRICDLLKRGFPFTGFPLGMSGISGFPVGPILKGGLAMRYFRLCFYESKMGVLGKLNFWWDFSPSVLVGALWLVCWSG